MYPIDLEDMRYQIHLYERKWIHQASLDRMDRWLFTALGHL
jgi:hypothetical protein